MQDKYVGDIGDFGKYALLKSLARSDLKLGIVWYLTSTKGRSGDGGFTQYLSSPNEAIGLGRCDLELFNRLGRIVRNKDRRVVRVREDHILPAKPTFYEVGLDYNGIPLSQRGQRREDWFANALKQVEEAALVFLDPDNGLSLNEQMRYRGAGPKYTFLNEVRPFLGRGQSLIIYCHQDRRKGGLVEQVRQGLDLFRAVSPTHEAWALTFHRRSVRIFFVVPTSKAMARLLAQRSRAFINGSFGAAGHFRAWGL